MPKSTYLQLEEADSIVSHFFANQPDPINSNEQLVTSVIESSPLSDSSIEQPIKTFSTNGNQDGYLLINNLSVDPSPGPTPSTQEAIVDKQTRFSEFWLSAIIALVGEQFTFKQMKGGELFHNISPRKGNEGAISSKGSSVVLDLHTDLAFHPLAPHLLLLFCIRQASANQDAYTVVSSLKNALSALSDEIVAILRDENNFLPVIDEDYGSMKDSTVAPIIYGTDEDPMLRYDTDMIIPLNKPARMALEALHQALQLNECHIILQPGQVLIIDNRRAVHGRNAFTASYDGNDRWFQRAYAHTNPAMLCSYFFKGKVVDYDFKQQQNDVSGDDDSNGSQLQASSGSLYNATS